MVRPFGWYLKLFFINKLRGIPRSTLAHQLLTAKGTTHDIPEVS
jgi:hypothetical protein